MIILHKEAGAFIHWVEENKKKLDPHDLEILNKVRCILINVSSFEWYWLWESLKFLITEKLSDPDVNIEE